MQRDEFESIARHNKKIRAEVRELLAPAFGPCSMRDAAEMVGANVKTVADVLNNPQKYTGKKPETGRPSTGGASAYEIVGQLQSLASKRSKENVLREIVKIISEQ